MKEPAHLKGNPEEPRLWLIGYGGWPTSTRAAEMVATLKLRRVTLLVDVRLSPCSSDPGEGRPYGPRPWNLQAGRSGILGLLDEVGIVYEWIVELGNPQRLDPSMVVLKDHLADPLGRWPVHRGLDRLASLIRQPGEVVALLCACKDWRTCHRTLIARASSDRDFGGRLALADARTGEAIPGSPIMGG